jgi:hypothetical protein
MKPDNDLAVVGPFLPAGVCELVRELVYESRQAHWRTPRIHAGILIICRGSVAAGVRYQAALSWGIPASRQANQ